MKLHHYPETDRLYIELKTMPGAAGEVVGFDIDDASRRPDLTTVETMPVSRPCRSRAPGRPERGVRT